MLGKFYGVGIGPGSPDLLTLRAKRVLEAVKVICVPRATTGENSLARSILEKALTGAPQYLELDFPMVRDKETLRQHWDRAVERMVERLQMGEDVAFATLGDPLLYSTYNYVLSIMQQRFPQVTVETVPGLSSFSAAASLANLSLAEGEEAVAILPVPRDPGRLERVLREFDTVVLMKVAERLGMVLEVLRRLGLMEKAVLVSRAGLPGETLVRDLSSITDAKLGYLSVIIVANRERKGT
ncbi:MAG: precorrin-2 C(20)-methyltransferase [Dehalococcoidia bacterium]|nr:precorrin-2 C(20)-methyltransferase [Dehalococcoidia bacterium]